jgi:hypothetical protein
MPKINQSGVSQSGVSGLVALADGRVDTLGDGAIPGFVQPVSYTFQSMSANLLTTGEEALPREIATSQAVVSSSGQIRLTYFTARKSEVTTQVRMYSGSTAAGATPTLCRIGLWLAASDGSCSALVASTANDTSLFAATNTAYTRSWSASYTKIAGQRYAVGALVVTAATAPTLSGQAGFIFGESSADPVIAGVATSQADLPASMTTSVAGSGGGRPYVVILP